jgi:hypothetical protein
MLCCLAISTAEQGVACLKTDFPRYAIAKLKMSVHAESIFARNLSQTSFFRKIFSKTK